MDTGFERSRSFSNSWHSNRPRTTRIATVKPVSKSFSEDDLVNATMESKDLRRVFSRLKVNDLSSLKKDSLIGELEKCLEELETKDDNTQHLSSSYQRVESERNQLLDELDVAFQDLQEYMKRQKAAEDEKTTVETDRDELSKENEYLKSVLADRTQIQETKLQEQNRVLKERVKEIEKKNADYLDEIKDLQEERQTLIGSLLHLNSEKVNNVIKSKSRSSSVNSSCSYQELIFPQDFVELQFDKLEDSYKQGRFSFEELRKVTTDYKAEMEAIKKAFHRVKLERNDAEKEVQNLKDDLIDLNEAHEVKIKEFDKLREDRNEKNLTISKVNLDKRTLQRQLDHFRESNRKNTVKIASLNKEIDDLSNELQECQKNKNTDMKLFEQQILKQRQEFEECLLSKNNKIEEYENNIAEFEEEMKAIHQINQDLQNKLHENTADQDYRISLEREITFHKEVNQNVEKENQILAQKVVLLGKQKKENLSKLQQVKDGLKSKEQQCNILKSDMKKFQNHISTLEIEKNKLESSKTVTEQRLQTSELSLRDITQSKEVSDKKLEDLYKLNNKQIKDDENCISSNFQSLQKEYEDLLDRCQHLEGSVDEMSKLLGDNKQLRNEKESLEKRCREHENEKNHQIRAKEKERQNYSALLVKYDDLCKSHEYIKEKTNDCTSIRKEYQTLKKLTEELGKQNEKLLSENENQKNISNKLDELKIKNDKLTVEYDHIHKECNMLQKNYDKILKDHKRLIEHNQKIESENNNNIELIKQQVIRKDEDLKLLMKENENFHRVKNDDENMTTQPTELIHLGSTIKDLKHDNDTKQEKINELEKRNTFVIEESKSLQSEHEILIQKFKMSEKENEEIKTKIKTLEENLTNTLQTHQRMEKDYIYILQSHKEEAQANLMTKKKKSDKEKHSLKLKYESLRVEHEKLRKEKELNESTIENLRHDLEKSNTQIQKLRLRSNSSHDIAIQNLTDECNNLEKKNELLENNIKELNKDNLNLLDRINRTDESMATTIRILKARKNELQLEVEKLKHDNQLLRNNSNNNVEKSNLVLQNKSDEVNEQITSLEKENKEYSKKLHETELLLFELHQALAKANDMAMQKSLEISKLKRNSEKKIAKLSQVNMELKKKLLSSDSSTSLDNFQPTILDLNEMKSQLTLELDGPIAIKRSSSKAPIVNSPILQKKCTNRKISLQVELEPRSKSVPQSPHVTSKLTRAVASHSSYNELNQVNDVANFSRPALESTGSLSEKYEEFETQLSPSIEVSRQIELDLSQQLKELLDLTDTLVLKTPKIQMKDGSTKLKKYESWEKSVKTPRQNEHHIDENLDNSIVNSNNKSEHWV